MEAESVRTEQVYADVADHVVRMLRASPLLGAAVPGEINSADGDAPPVDPLRLASVVACRVVEEFGGQDLRTFPERTDPGLIAAAIVLELLPTRLLPQGAAGYADLATVAKRVAREIGVPRSSLQPLVQTNPDLVRW